MIDLTAYVASRRGRTIDTDGYYGGQCMDLINDYSAKLGLPGTLAAPTAAQVWQRASGAWTRVTNTPAGIPPAGAVVVVRGSKANPAGHVFIALPGATTTAIPSLHQNWRGKFVSREVVGYGGVIGWLIPPATAGPDIDKMARDVIAGKYGVGATRRAKLGSYFARVQARVNQIMGGR